MTQASTNVLEIHAFLWPTEQALFQAAARVLSECLEAAGHPLGSLRLTLHDAVRSDFLVANGPGIPEELHHQQLVPPSFRDYRGSLYQAGKRIVVMSLLADLLQPAWRHRHAGYQFVPVPAWQQTWTPAQHAWLAEHFVEERPQKAAAAVGNWLEICTEIMRSGEAGLFLCTVFRHVPQMAHGHAGSSQNLRERIERFNLLATEVSHDSGACVIDLDRALSEIGARALKTDYLLAGQRAAIAGADAVVATLLQAGLNDLVPADVLEKATACFESRHAGPQRIRVCEYLLMLEGVLEEMSRLAKAADGAQAMLHLSDFVRSRASHLGKFAAPGNLALHRRFVHALQELGDGFRQMSEAQATGNGSAIQQARQRADSVIDELKLLWKAIHEFCQRHIERAR